MINNPLLKLLLAWSLTLNCSKMMMIQLMLSADYCNVRVRHMPLTGAL